MSNDAGSIIKGTIAALNSHDIDKLISFYMDECVYEDMALGRVSHGKEELKAFFQNMFVWSPDVKFESKSAFNAGDWAASEWVMSGTHTGNTPQLPATGKKFSIRGASINQIHNGKVSRQSDYWNLMSFLQQVGLMPST
jgi:steroid delta-isomerase-like uncharacterized protein